MTVSGVQDGWLPQPELTLDRFLPKHRRHEELHTAVLNVTQLQGKELGLCLLVQVENGVSQLVGDLVHRDDQPEPCRRQVLGNRCTEGARVKLTFCRSRQGNSEGLA